MEVLTLAAVTVLRVKGVAVELKGDVATPTLPNARVVTSLHLVYRNGSLRKISRFEQITLSLPFIRWLVDEVFFDASSLLAGNRRIPPCMPEEFRNGVLGVPRMRVRNVERSMWMLGHNLLTSGMDA